MKAPHAMDDPDDQVFFTRAIELKDEGNAAYAGRDYKRALAFYEQALGLLPEKDAMRAQVYSNRAACFYQLQFFADVVAEASMALKVDGKSAKAMFHRANAYTALGNVSKAKKDYMSVIALDGSNIDAKKALDRLNGTVTKDAPAGLGGMNLAPAKRAKEGKKSAAAAAPDPTPEQAVQQEVAEQAVQTQREPPLITLKCVFGNDIRMFNVFSTLSHRDLVKSIATKFPAAGQFSIKYEDYKTASIQPIQSTKDFQTAIFSTSQRLSEMERPPLIPYVTLYIQDLPKIEDIALIDENGNPAGLAPNEVVEIDEWILDFAALFREHLGIDAEAHLELHSEGMNLCSDAVHPSVSNEQAQEMFDTAVKKFQEAAAVAMFNWGNVHMTEARKKMDGGREPPVEVGGPPGAAIATAEAFDDVEALLNLAKTRFTDSLAIKPDHHDALIALAQRRYECARLLCGAAGLSGDEGKVAKGHDAKERTAQAEAEFIGAAADYAAVLSSLPEEKPKEKTEEEKAEFARLVEEAKAKGEDPPTDEDPSLKAQVTVMLGNTLFEHSQMLARLGKDWNAHLDKALAHFKAAGCAQGDIDGAIKMHYGIRKGTK